MTWLSSSEFDSFVDLWLLTPDAEIEAFVRHHRVLPILQLIGGTYFFRHADSQVLCLGWGPQDILEIVQDPSERVYALVVGAKKYPQLAAFLPTRPIDASECIQCRGTGVLLKYMGCGVCWSLGWLHDSVQGAPPNQAKAEADYATAFQRRAPTGFKKLFAWLRF